MLEVIHMCHLATTINCVTTTPSGRGWYRHLLVASTGAVTSLLAVSSNQKSRVEASNAMLDWQAGTAALSRFHNF